MPFFQLDDSSLVPFQRQAITAQVYEREIEDLLWDNLEELTGDNLFRVARQPVLPLGRPDVLALDKQGRIVVIEVKRDVDRMQLAQALEYAGWARTVGLDEMASKYHGGAQGFFEDWQEFTGTDTPVLVQRDPQLVLVARTFEEKTAQALDFLLHNGLPVKLLRLAFYADENGKRFLNVEWETEPETTVTAPSAPTSSSTGSTIDFREVTLADVAKLVGAPTELVWVRPRKGERYEATLRADGRIWLADGRDFRSPSGAAMAAAQMVSYDGWHAWRVGDTGPTLHDIRLKVVAASGTQTSDQPEVVRATDPAEIDLDGDPRDAWLESVE